jgi:AcrR family transcriptional regulator
LATKINNVSPLKNKMLEKASTLFWKKGYSGTSMRDIAEACKCKPANIYNFFNSKEDILFEFLYQQNQRLYDLIKHFENDQITKPSNQLREFIKIHIKHLLNYQKTSRYLFDSGLERLSHKNREKVISFRDIYDDILTGIIKRGIEEKEFRDIDAKMVARNIASMIVRTIIWYSPKGELSINGIAEFIYEFSVHGLKSDQASSINSCELL